MPEPAPAHSGPTVLVDGLRVGYVVCDDRVTSFKEYAIRRLQGRLARRELWALDGVSLTAAAGETMAVIGRNGAGKSTLLKALAGVLTPTAGRVRVAGWTVPLLGVGAGLQADLSGRENTMLALTLLGFDRHRARALVAEVADFAELASVLERPLRQYSAGMVARLGFAAATVRRPDVLLIDEVLAVGDERFQNKCLERISGFAAAGTSVILVSHSGPAVSFCRTAVLLRDGAIAAAGAPGEVLAEYRRQDEAAPRSVVMVPAAAPEPAPGTPDDDALIAALRRRCGDIDSLFFGVRVFAELRQHAATRGFELTSVLEIGPRHLPAVLLCCGAAGARRVANTAPGAAPSPAFVTRLKAYLAPVGGFGWWRRIADLYPGGPLESEICWNDVDLGAIAARLERIVPATSGRLPLADASFSFAYSIGSLAHVADPEVVVAETARVLAPGGGLVFEITLSDLNDPDILGPLRVSEDDWRRTCDQRSSTAALFEVPAGVPPHLAYGHRWRTSDFVAALERAGLGEIEVEPVIRLPREQVDREGLAAPFGTKDVADLAIVAVRISARKGDRGATA